LQEHYVMRRVVSGTIDLLSRAEAAGERVLVFGGLVQLHAVAQVLLAEGRTLHLAPGSILGSGGGLKELYPFTEAQIRADVAQAVHVVQTNQPATPVMIRDVYGMAEGNWAAMQCTAGNYHVPPWIYARSLDEDGHFQEEPEATGLLAFLDPYGGGNLFPSFFNAADRVHLVRPEATGSTDLRCPCGEEGTYISRDSIVRVDLVDEAGCAGQV
jgi:hypothetical protein